MKKILPYIFLVLLLTSMFILIIRNREINNTKVITIESLHSYLYNDEQTIQIPIYVTGKNHTFDEIDSYESTFLFNDDDIKIYIDLKEITHSHVEQYLGDKYIKYILKFAMPNLTEDFTILNAKLNITLINGDEINFIIGDLYLKYLSNNSDVSFISLDSKSEVESVSCQMDLLEIELDKAIVNIENIAISNDHSLPFTIDNKKLLINVPKIDLCINYIPLWIEFDNQVITINNYYYIIDYNLLEKAGKLINIYVFD